MIHHFSSLWSGLTSSSKHNDERQLLKLPTFRSWLLEKRQLPLFLSKKTWKRVTRKSHIQPHLWKGSKAFSYLDNIGKGSSGEPQHCTVPLNSFQPLVCCWKTGTINGERKHIGSSPISLSIADTIIHRWCLERVPLHFQYKHLHGFFSYLNLVSNNIQISPSAFWKNDKETVYQQTESHNDICSTNFNLCFQVVFWTLSPTDCNASIKHIPWMRRKTGYTRKKIQAHFCLLN